MDVVMNRMGCNVSAWLIKVKRDVADCDGLQLGAVFRATPGRAVPGPNHAAANRRSCLLVSPPPVNAVTNFVSLNFKMILAGKFWLVTLRIRTK
jgi:hypothetical protein